MGLTPGLLLFLPVIGLAVCVVAHVVVSRALPGLSHQHGIAMSVLVGCAAVASLVPWSLQADVARLPAIDLWGSALASVITYVLLAYCYVIGFFNIGESARRIRLLIELEAAGERGLSLAEILTLYNARMIIDSRLQRLLSGGQIIERGGRYFIRGRVMLYAAKALMLLKAVLLKRPAS